MYTHICDIRSPVHDSFLLAAQYKLGHQLQKIMSWILSLRSAPPSSSEAAPAAPGQSYTYTSLDGKQVTSDVELFQPGTKKITLSVFHGYEQFNSYCFRCHGEELLWHYLRVCWAGCVCSDGITFGATSPGWNFHPQNFGKHCLMKTTIPWRSYLRAMRNGTSI